MGIWQPTLEASRTLVREKRTDSSITTTDIIKLKPVVEIKITPSFESSTVGGTVRQTELKYLNLASDFKIQSQNIHNIVLINGSIVAKDEMAEPFLPGYFCQPKRSIDRLSPPQLWYSPDWYAGSQTPELWLNILWNTQAQVRGTLKSIMIQ